MSPEALAAELLRRSLDLLRKRHRDASHLARTWTEEEAREFAGATAPLIRLTRSCGVKARRRKGTPIPTNNWIAAIAPQHHFGLFTYDAHFKKVDGLRIGSTVVELLG
jgi:predicted nucleic acid-binding protein